MKLKRPPCPSPQAQKVACTKRIPKLNPAYYGNIACLIRLYLRICRNPYLHLPRVRANREMWGFVEQERGHFYLDLGLDLPAGQSEWDCVFRACRLPSSLQQGDDEAEEHFGDILNAMSMMFYLPAYALAQPQSAVRNKTVLLARSRPPAAKRPAAHRTAAKTVFQQPHRRCATQAGAGRRHPVFRTGRGQPRQTPPPARADRRNRHTALCR